MYVHFKFRFKAKYLNFLNALFFLNILDYNSLIKKFILFLKILNMTSYATPIQNGTQRINTQYFFIKISFFLIDFLFIKF